MDDLFYFDLQGDSTLQNLNTVIENDIRPEKIETNNNEQDFIGINENTNKKKNKKKKGKKKNQRTHLNPTVNRPIIIDDDVYIDTENIDDSDDDDSDDDNIVSSNAFDILNLTRVDDDIDDEIVKDYLENCKNDSENDESNTSISEKQVDNENKDKDEIEFLNSAFAKNIIKSDVGVDNEPKEMEMDLIRYLENKLLSDSSSDESNEDLIQVDNHLPNTTSNVKNNKKKKKNKKNKKANKKNNNNSNSQKSDMVIDVDDVPIINLEDAIIELDSEPDLKEKQEVLTISTSTGSTTPSVIIQETKSKLDKNDDDVEVIDNRRCSTSCTSGYS